MNLVELNSAHNSIACNKKVQIQPNSQLIGLDSNINGSSHHVGLRVAQLTNSNFIVNM